MEPINNTMAVMWNFNPSGIQEQLINVIILPLCTAVNKILNKKDTNYLTSFVNPSVFHLTNSMQHSPFSLNSFTNQSTLEFFFPVSLSNHSHPVSMFTCVSWCCPDVSMETFSDCWAGESDILSDKCMNHSN